MQINNLPVAIIGAGPIGLAAAAHLLKRGETPLVFEAERTVGAAVLRWGHVRLFSPWRELLDRESVALLAAEGWQAPDPAAYPTGQELVEDYLVPLANTVQIKPHLRLGTRVVAVSRQGIDKMKTPGREEALFALRLETASGEEQDVLARAVIDASGTYGTPNPLGASGIPALGEQALREHIFYGIPDILGAQRKRYQSRRVLVVPLDATFGWGRASISGAYALGLIVAGLLGVPIGSLVDRWGARLLMSSGSVLAALALFEMAHMAALWQFYLLWSGGLGLAMALTLYPVTFTVVANWFVRKRGKALAVLTLVGGLSSPICIPLAGALVAHVGWRATLIVLALLQFVIALPLHALLLRRHLENLGFSPDGEPALPVQAHASLPGATLAEALLSRVFWMLTASLALVMLGSTVVFVHQVAFMISRGTDAVLAATLSGMLGLASLPGRYVFNVLSSRISAQKLLTLSVVAQALGIVVLVLTGSSLAWLILYVLIYGSAYGAFSPLRASVMADHFGRRAYGAITAVQGIPVALCAGLGPLAAGWLYDGLHHYELAFWLCAGAFLLAASGLVLVPRPGERHNGSSQARTVTDADMVESKG